jgi:pyruvyl transferase EpsI
MKRTLTEIDIYDKNVIRLYGLWLLTVVTLVRLRRKKVIFLLGFPRHINLGDQAIMMAEVKFIKDKVGAVPIPVPISMVLQDKKDILSRMVRPSDVITGMGGGNMGEVYIFEELCRRKFIEQFPDNKIAIFPQTIHFSNTKEGVEELKKSQTIYEQHKDLHLIAREKISYDIIRSVFPGNKVILTPDIVLSLNRSEKCMRRDGLLLCIRNDLEASLNVKDRAAIKDFEKNHFNGAKYTDTLATAKFFRYTPTKAVLRSKLREFKTAKLVITDRLHGMIFAAITGTPCIALSNYNHKVSTTYDWVKYLPYIKFCDDTAKLEQIFEQIDLDKTYTYSPAHFDEYWGKIGDCLTANDAQ